ncbi:MAG: hybrid sensor histidine kinase/response regulator [Deltaproteobacteria bacterium]|nr:hybrid sensor histidine kinase/response regulator [Deltaproteobacteria bacterium]
MDSRRKLLTIDDEDIIRIAIATFFEDCGYDVMEASEGGTGLELFRKEKPDIILTDLNMPGVDGFEVVKTVKEESHLTPTIVLSGAGRVEDSIRAIRDGAWDYITKPFIDMAEVEHVVNKTLERAWLIQQNEQHKEHLEAEVKIRTEELRELNEQLEDKVKERTIELQESLDRLKQTQEQLVQSEKMASLGGLVAGVAHEINTPIGIGVTAASHLQEQTKYFAELYAAGTLARSDFESYVNTARESSQMMLSNLNRAADLIHGFKQVAVDQSSEERRSFKIKGYVEEVLQSLRPQLGKTRHSVTVTCQEDFTVNSFPGALAQIVTNFVLNSLQHGFEDMSDGRIDISIARHDTWARMVYQDSGRGLTPETCEKIFEPFYTTKRSRGGSGLGMHIVYNLVTQTLGGTITCSSTPGNGIRFELQFSCNKEEQ